MRVLGLDLGSKRIGLAISDSEGDFAFPAGTLKSAGRKADVAAVAELIEEREIGQVVIGLPRHMDGRAGPEADAALAFAKALHKATGLEVETIDERWTSVEAERVLKQQGKRSKKVRQEVDAVAASIILRTFLDLQRNRAAREALAGGPEEE
jgi:putative Holliday junction resolvase